MTDDELSEKLIDLEIRLTHQEDYIEQLNNSIYQQQNTITQLQQQLNIVVKRLKTVFESDSQILSAEDETPPPHY